MGGAFCFIVIGCRLPDSMVCVNKNEVTSSAKSLGKIHVYNVHL